MIVFRTKDARPVSNLGQEYQYIRADTRLTWKLGIQEGELAGSFSFS